MKYIAVDIGSSVVKSALLDVDALCIERGKNYQLQNSYQGAAGMRYEISARKILDLFRNCIDAYMRQYKNAIHGILVSTQMHGFLFCDASGNPTSPFVTWQDNRCLCPAYGGNDLNRLRRRISKKNMNDNGVYLKPGLALCNAYTLLHEGEYPQQDGNLITTLGGFLLRNLTGEAYCHISNAGATGFADVRNNCFNTALIRKSGFDRFTFPALAGEWTSPGFYRNGKQNIPVYPDMGDQQMAVLGSLLEESSDLNINIATAAQMACISDKFTIGEYETRPFVDGKYLNTITRIPGGRAFDPVLTMIEGIVNGCGKRHVSKADIWEYIYEEISKTGKTSLKCDVGFYKDTLGARDGRFFNIEADNFGIGSIFRSLYDRIGDIYLDYFGRLKSGEKNFSRIVFTGGVAVKDKYLRKSLSQKLGLPGVVSPLPDEVFLGHFRMALVHSKKCASLDETRLLIMNPENPSAVLIKQTEVK